MTLRTPFVGSPSFIRAAIRRIWLVLVTLLLFPATGFAQSPWERAAATSKRRSPAPSRGRWRSSPS